MKALKYLNTYLYKYRFLLLSGLFFIICSNAFAILIAPIVRTAVDTMVDDIGTYSLLQVDAQILARHFGKLSLFFGLLVLLSAVLKGIFMYFMRQTIIVMSRNIEYDLKNEIFSHYQRLGADFYNKNYTGDLMNRISEDVSRVRMYLGPAVMYTLNMFVLFAMVITVMISINPRITMWVLLPLPVLSLSIYYISDVINRRSDMLQQKLSDITTFTQEVFSGIRVIKSFAVEKWFYGAFEKETEAYRQRNLDLVKVNALFHPMMLMLVGLSVIITVYTGGKAVIYGAFSYGNIAEYVIYVNMLTWPVASLGWVTSLVQRAEASQARINEFLLTKAEDTESGSPECSFTQQLEFRQVSFRYDAEQVPVIRDLSFVLKKGSTIGIIGPTGSGKSTLAKLLLRSYSPDSGSIELDGQPVENFQRKAYRKLFGYVPQDVFLFSDSIANNIRFGTSAGRVSEDRIMELADIADVHSDIMEFPKKYNTILGERGISLSGGQKQRVAIARALACEPEVLVLDDCLSAVDTGTEARIKEKLIPFLKQRSSIVISHRVSSVEMCDHIIVLDRGSIAEQGTKAELIQAGGLFARMAEMQQQRDRVAGM